MDTSGEANANSPGPKTVTMPKINKTATPIVTTSDVVSRWGAVRALAVTALVCINGGTMLTSTCFRKQRGKLWAVVVFCAALRLVGGPATAAPAQSGGAKYYFQIVDIQGDVPEATRKAARDLLEKELLSRAVFTRDLGGAEASAETLKKKGMRGFETSLRFESVTREVKDAKPGRRGKQLALGVRISIFGSEIPSKKLAFSGEGESLQIVEVEERRLEKEAIGLTGEVLADAVRQAVDQAVLKLSLPSSAPVNRGKKRPLGGKTKKG